MIKFKRKMGVVLSLVVFLGSLSFADTYKIDPVHSDVGFAIQHLGISKVRGQFRDVKGKIEWEGEKKLKDASFLGNIRVESIDTNNKKRDDHLRSSDFFDAKKYPEITFKSKSLKKRKGKIVINGDLTIHGVTKEVSVPVEVFGPVKDPWGNTKIGFEGRLKINRKDYGLKWNKVLESGGLLVGDDVWIDLRIEAQKES